MPRILLLNPRTEIVEQLHRSMDLQLSWLSPPYMLEHFQNLGLPNCGHLYEPDGAKLDLRAIASVRRALASQQPDLIFAPTGRPLAHAILANIGSGNSARIVAFRGITSQLNRWDPAEWLTYLNPRVDGFACESVAVQQALVKSGIAEDKCATIYNYVAPPTNNGWARSDLEQFDIPPAAFVVGMVANLRPVKGADVLLEAMHQLRDDERIYCLLLGSVRDARVRKMLQDPQLARRVRAVGYRHDAPQWMNALDVFVMPSRHEALCRALLEAMSRGICPLVSDAGGLPEAVRHQLDGLVVPRENPTALAKAISGLADDPLLCSQLGAAAAVRYRQSFTPELWCQQLSAYFARVLAQDNPPLSFRARRPAKAPARRAA